MSAHALSCRGSLALALALALPRCSIDVSELRMGAPAVVAGAGAGAGEAGQPATRAGAGAAAPAAGSGGAGTSGQSAVAGAAGIRGPSVPDAGDKPIDTTGRTCGIVGLPCCNPGNLCDLGACLRGVCTPYGGFYMHSPDCMSEPCGSRNAYTAGCSCPFGFDDALLWQTVSACPNRDPVVTEVRSCTSDRTGQMGFGGTWVEEPNATSCAVSCIATNPYTGSCGCPDGTTGFPITGHVTTDNCSAAARTLALCMKSDGKPLNFGGAYGLSQAADDGCGLPNPLTGTCSCPEAADEVPAPQNLQVGDASLFICNL